MSTSTPAVCLLVSRVSGQTNTAGAAPYMVNYRVIQAPMKAKKIITDTIDQYRAQLPQAKMVIQTKAIMHDFKSDDPDVTDESLNNLLDSFNADSFTATDIHVDQDDNTPQYDLMANVIAQDPKDHHPIAQLMAFAVPIE